MSEPPEQQAPKKAPKKRKPRTRRNGDGRPYQRKSDGKWVATYYDTFGRRRVAYGNDKEEAESKREKAKAELANQQPVTVGSTLTVGRYLDQWVNVTLAQRVKAGRLEESTRDSYADTVTRHVSPHLGKVLLVELGTAHIRRWLMELAEKPSGRQRKKLRPGETKLPPPVLLSTRTQAYAHAVFKKAIEDAVSDELTKRNVVKLVDPPVVTRTPTKTPTKEEASRLLGAAAGDRLWALWVTLLALGLRRGEVLGMRWSLIDLDAGTVRLEKQVQRRRGEKDSETGRRRGALIEKKLKTAASQATMRLPAVVIEALKEHRRAQAEEILAARVWSDEDLVFASTVGTPLEPRNLSREWEAVCNRAEVGQFKIHSLRHAAATFLFAEGLDPKIIQSTLRHSRLQTTVDVYTHLLEEVKDGAASAMNGVLVDLTAARKQRSAS